MAFGEGKRCKSGSNKDGENKKSGGKIPDDQVDEVKFLSKNHNHWFIQIIYERFHQADWFMRACCRVDDTESEIPEYYLLRGFSNNGSETLRDFFPSVLIKMAKLTGSNLS